MEKCSNASGSLNRTGSEQVVEVQLEPATQVNKNIKNLIKNMGDKYFQDCDQNIWVTNMFMNLANTYG